MKNEQEEVIGESEQGFDTLRAHEEPTQNPEERRRRELVRQKEELLNRALARIEEAKLQSLEAQVSKARRTESPPLQAQPVATTKEIRREMMSATSGAQRAKEHLRLGLSGVNSLRRSSEVLPLLYYLESRVLTPQTEKEMVSILETGHWVRKYERQGYEVNQGDVKGTKVELFLARDAPYKPSRKALGHLPKLVGQENDPIEVIDRLRSLGFALKGEKFEREQSLLQEFIALPDMKYMLEVFDKLEMRRAPDSLGFFADSRSPFSTALNVRNFVQDEPIRELFSDARVTDIKILKDACRLNIPFRPNYLKEFSEIVTDQERIDLFVCLVEALTQETMENEEILKEINLLAHKGFAKDIITLCAAGIDLVDSSFFRAIRQATLYTKDEEDKFIEKITEFLSQPSLKKVLESKENADFLGNIVSLSSWKILPETTEQYLDFKQYPDAVALLEALRETDMVAGVYPGDFRRLLQGKIDSDREARDLLFNPECRALIKRLQGEEYKERFTVAMFLNDRSRSCLTSLLQSPEQQAKLFSSKGKEIIKHLGNFRIDDVKLYLDLIDDPHTMDVLKNLERLYSYKPHTEYATLSLLRSLCDAPHVQSDLFTDDAKALYKELNSQFDYTFDIQDMHSFLSLKNDPALRRSAFTPDNVAFIKKVSEIRYLSSRMIKEFTSLAPETKKAMEALHQDFAYWFFSSNLSPDSYQLMSRLPFDKRLQQELKQGNEEGYKNRVAQEICVDFLNRGDSAHDYLEKIKKDQWITIQTYNRLYAARRSNTGFESYAYHAREGENHPTINTTFYRNSLGEVLKEHGDKLRLDKKEDTEGFYEGFIGNIKIRIYPETYRLYEATIEKYRSKGEQLQKVPEDFTWYESPKISANPEYEQLLNQTLPLGVATNGHTHYYATPYGIVSGCVSVTPDQSGIFENEHIAALGVGIITGHREMLSDFLAKHRNDSIEVKTDKTELLSTSAIRIDFDDPSIPVELKQMALPAGISLSEALLNLHIEQYLHPISRDRQFLENLVIKIESGEMGVFIKDRQITMNDRIPKGSKIILRKEGQDQERLAA